MVSNIGVILETRIGLKTIERKKITARGIKPIGLVQWNFKAYYLYGAVAPQTGENFWLEFSHLDGQCFQIFLHNLAAEYPEHLNVVQVDNGKFHHSSLLKIPDNILLVFQPPYSPELNPIDRIWQYIKQELSWGLYDNLDEIKEKVRSFLEEFSTETIASIAGWDYIRAALATLCIILEKWYKSCCWSNCWQGLNKISSNSSRFSNERESNRLICEWPAVFRHLCSSGK